VRKKIAKWKREIEKLEQPPLSPFSKGEGMGGGEPGFNAGGSGRAADREFGTTNKLLKVKRFNERSEVVEGGAKMGQFFYFGRDCAVHWITRSIFPSIVKLLVQ